MPKDTIKWILGFVIFGLISMIGVVGYNQVKIQNNKILNQQNTVLQNESLKHIKENQESLKNLQNVINLKINQIPSPDYKKSSISDAKQNGENIQ